MYLYNVIYIYVHTYIHTYMHMYIYMYPGPAAEERPQIQAATRAGVPVTNISHNSS